MAVYCINYDLIDQKKYGPLHDKLKKYRAHCHALESVWFIETDDSASEIRAELKKVVDNDDKIIVIEVVKHWATYNTPKKLPEWLRKNL